MFDYLLNESQKKFRDEVRDFVNWVPREMILDMDADRIKFPKDFLREAGRQNPWDDVTPKGGAAGTWIGSAPAPSWKKSAPWDMNLPAFSAWERNWSVKLSSRTVRIYKRKNILSLC